MTILTKIVDGTKINLGAFENGNNAFDLMIRDFLKEAKVKDIPKYIDEDFVDNELEDLVEDYEMYTEYGYNDGEANSFFFSKGLTDYYWYLSYKK